MAYFSLIEHRQYSSTSEEDSSYSEMSMNNGPVCSTSNSPDATMVSKLLLSKSSEHVSTSIDHVTSSSKNGGKHNTKSTESHLSSEASSVEPLRPVELSDWHTLLFGAKDVPSCKEIPTFPESDSYFVDCKLAEDASLNYVAGLDLPVFNSLRDFNQGLVSRVLKNSSKMFHSAKDEAVALSMMLDFVSCCCQNGNLLNLYEKCKDSKKIEHLQKLFDDLHYLRGLKLHELRAVEKIVIASIERLPSHLKVVHSFLTSSLKRNITLLEEEEKKKASCPVFSFSVDEDQVLPISKKRKTSLVVSPSNNWKVTKMDPDSGVSKKKKTDSTSYQLKSKKKSISVPVPAMKKIQSGLPVSDPEQLRQLPSEWREGSPFTDYSLESNQSILARWLSSSPSTSDDETSHSKNHKTQFTSTPHSKRNHEFSCNISFSEEEDSNAGFKKSNKNEDQASCKLLTSKESMSQISKKRSVLTPKKQVQRVSCTDQNSFNCTPNFYSSDDSLPDIPMDMPVYYKKPISTLQEPSLSYGVTARSKNGDETSVKPTQKQQLSNSKVITKPSSSSQAPDTLTKSNNTPEGKRNTSILDFFSKIKDVASSAKAADSSSYEYKYQMQNKSEFGSHEASQRTAEFRSPLKSLQYDSRDVTLLDINKSSKKLASEKTPKLMQNQTKKLPGSLVSKKSGLVPPRPWPEYTSSDSEASCDSHLTKDSVDGGTSASSRLAKPQTSPYKTKLNVWNSSKFVSPSKTLSSSGLLLSPRKDLGQTIKVSAISNTKYRSPLKSPAICPLPSKAPRMVEEFVGMPSSSKKFKIKHSRN